MRIAKCSAVKRRHERRKCYEAITLEDSKASRCKTNTAQTQGQSITATQAWREERLLINVRTNTERPGKEESAGTTRSETPFATPKYIETRSLPAQFDTKRRIERQTAAEELDTLREGTERQIADVVDR